MINKYNIPNTLKKLRNDNNLSVKEVSEKLKKYNIDINSKTIYNYENGISSPNADTFLALCEIYGCIDIFNTFNTEEYKKIFNKQLIKKQNLHFNKYKQLKEPRQNRVDKITDMELDEQRQEELKSSSGAFLKG